VYVVQRGQSILTGHVVQPGRIEGGIEVRNFDQKVLDAWPSFLAKSPKIEPNPKESRFTLSPIAADSTCETLRGASAKPWSVANTLRSSALLWFKKQQRIEVSDRPTAAPNHCEFLDLDRESARKLSLVISLTISHLSRFSLRVSAIWRASLSISRKSISIFGRSVDCAAV